MSGVCEGPSSCRCLGEDALADENLTAADMGAETGGKVRYRADRSKS
jgi:hypothetical protein